MDGATATQELGRRDAEHISHVIFVILVVIHQSRIVVLMLSISGDFNYCVEDATHRSPLE
jgi:hypothetical protein